MPWKPAQLDACRRFAERHDWLVVATYHDDGISGFEDERRPAFRRMLADMVTTPRPFDVVVVWDFSRFSRSLEHSLRTMHDLKAAGVSLESTKEQTDDSPAGWLMGAVFRSFNEFQVRKLAEDTRRGMHKNAVDGGWNGGQLPMGYRAEVDESERGPRRLTPDPVWAPLVQRIFGMALAGHGVTRIAMTLNDEGLRTPLGRAWAKTTLLYVLRNEVYTGTYTWGARPSGKFRAATAEPLRIEGAHVPLVSKADFARVAAGIEVRRPTVTRARTLNGAYLLTGLLECGSCGNIYVGHGARSGTHHYYTCQTKTKQGAKACPGARNFERARIEGLVVDLLKRGALTPAVFADLVREVRASLRAAQGTADAERPVLTAQVADIDRRLARLYEAVETGHVKLAHLGGRIAGLTKDKEEVLARIAALPAVNADVALDIADDEIEAWVSDLTGVLERGTVDERRTLLRAWVKRVVATGEDIRVEFTFPLVPVAGGLATAQTSGNGPGNGGTHRAARAPRRRGQGEQGGLPPTLGRRVLPVVQNGSPLLALGTHWDGAEGQFSGAAYPS